MLRSRIWLLTAVATFLVAGPVLAHWPVLFGVPVVFGQECPQTTASKPVMPYAEPAAASRPQACATTHASRDVLLGDCLAAWHRLWKQGRFEEAYELAKVAAKAAPDSADARHALAVSQMVMEAQATNAFRAFAQAQRVEWAAPLPPPPATLPTEVVQAPITATAAVQSVTSAPVVSTPADGECKIECPLTAVLEMVFGCGKQAAKTGCDGCPAKACCNERNFDCGVTRPQSAERAIQRDQCSLPFGLHADDLTKNVAIHITTLPECENDCCKACGQSGCCSLRTAHAQQGPTVIYIVRERTPTMATYYPQVIGMQPTPVAALPPAPLPPPSFAVPPPPFVSPDEGTAYIPVPVATVPAKRAQPVYQVNPVYFEPAEQCDAVCPAMATMPAGVHITQHGRRVQMISGSYRAECDRIRSVKGQLILEGNVSMMSNRHGQSMRITAQRVLLNVRDDQFVVEQAEGMESSRVNVAPVSITANEWMQELLKENETIGQIRSNSNIAQPPARLTPIRVHGGVGP